MWKTEHILEFLIVNIYDKKLESVQCATEMWTDTFQFLYNVEKLLKIKRNGKNKLTQKFKCNIILRCDSATVMR